MNQSEGHTQQKKKYSRWIEILDWLKYIIIAILLGLMIRNFIVQKNTVHGSSMFPTLEENDQLIVDKITRHFGTIRRGAIITIETKGLPNGSNEEDIVKRVIGLPNEEIEITGKDILINGEVLDEVYLNGNIFTEAFRPEYQKLKLKEDEYYVLGDNRANSKDSRIIGAIPQKNVLGIVRLRVYPFAKFGRID